MACEVCLAQRVVSGADIIVLVVNADTKVTTIRTSDLSLPSKILAPVRLKFLSCDTCIYRYAASTRVNCRNNKNGTFLSLLSPALHCSPFSIPLPAPTNITSGNTHPCLGCCQPSRHPDCCRSGNRSRCTCTSPAFGALLHCFICVCRFI